MGAGATKAVCKQAPLTENLLDDAFKKYPNNNRIQEVKQFIQDLFQITDRLLSKGSSGWPRIEDILSHLDIAIQEQRPFSNDYPLRKLEDLRYNVIYLIYKILNDSLKDLDNEATYKFVRKISEDSTIISLNYDIVVDNALLGLRWDKYGNRFRHVNYGCKIRGLIDWNGFHLEPNYDNLCFPIPLCKLHGSLNWLYCPTCSAIDLTEEEKGVYYIFDHKEVETCSYCGTKYEPLIITPTMVKRYDNSLLVQIWRYVEQAIRGADKLVFIGYSLPDSDSHIKYLINRGLALNQHAKDASLKIEVVTRLGAPNEKSDVIERYHKFFGNGIIYKPVGFENYLVW